MAFLNSVFHSINNSEVPKIFPAGEEKQIFVYLNSKMPIFEILLFVAQYTKFPYCAMAAKSFRPLYGNKKWTIYLKNYIPKQQIL